MSARPLPRVAPKLVRALLALVLMLALGAALLLVAPAPATALAFLAVALGEKTFVIALPAGVAGWLLWRATTSLASSERWIWRAAALAVLLPTLALCAWPPLSAYRLAREHQAPLSLRRYLTAPIDTGVGRPDGTVTFAKVEGGVSLQADFYRPVPTAAAVLDDQPAPAVIIVHGGGWSKGDKGEAAMWNRWLARRGFAVFDVTYRLSPQPNWRTATGDVKCAVGWVKEPGARTATGIAVDPDRVALLGRSAGGHLALLAAYTASDDDLPPSCPVRDARASAVVSLYGPTDLVWGYGRPANPRVYDTSQKLRDFLGGTPDSAPEAYQRASIVNRVTARAPRTLLVHGQRDQFVSPLHVDRLRPYLEKAEVEHEELVLPYGQHGFDYVFGGLGGQILETTLLRFLQRGVTMMAAAPPGPALSR